jgi:hypothetical protein
VTREEKLRLSIRRAFVMAKSGRNLNMWEDDLKIARVESSGRNLNMQEDDLNIARVESSGPYLGGPPEAGRLDTLTLVRHLAIRMMVTFEGKNIFY